MARGINKAIIVGNLGNDPETRTFPDGGQVTNITVATSESWKDKQTGQPQERTEWHKVSFNGRLAEIAAQYLRKGSKVYIEGSLRTRKYQDKKTGDDRYITDIVGREMQMLDSWTHTLGFFVNISNEDKGKRCILRNDRDNDVETVQRFIGGWGDESNLIIIHQVPDYIDIFNVLVFYARSKDGIPIIIQLIDYYFPNIQFILENTPVFV